MSPKMPRATAIAFIGNRIFAVGSNEDIESVSMPDKKIIDLGGKTLIPGMIDAHFHFMAYCRRFFTVELSGITDFELVLEKIGEQVKTAQKGEWITGGGWNKNLWKTDKFPTKEDLDRIAPENPVLLHARDGHSIWVNSLALKLAGIDKTVRDPQNGKFMRDETGDLTGVIFEEARHRVMDIVPEVSEERKIEMADYGIQQLYKNGLTGVHDMSSESKYSPLKILQKMSNSRAKPPKFRFNLSIAKDNLDAFIDAGIRSGFGDEYLRIGGLKLLADGALGSQTAYMKEPYDGDPTNTGILDIPPEKMEEHMRNAWQHGISCSIHSIGDKCNEIVLDIFERLAKRYPKSKSRYFRNRIEHVQCITPEDVERFAELGLMASMQPIHLPADIKAAEKYWGDRSKNAYVFRSLLNKGVTLAFGSDAPIETCDPIKGIHAAVSRQRENGTPQGGWYPEQSVSVEEAVYAYTMGAAIASGEDRMKGSLEGGKLADGVVFSQDIFEVTDEEILQTDIEMTIVDGEIVYQ
jgi:hypothetical protein